MQNMILGKKVVLSLSCCVGGFVVGDFNNS